MEIRNNECVIEGENMSEIPIPASDPYQQPKQSSGYGTCCKIGALACVLLIIGMVIIAMVFMGGVLSLFGGITTGGGTSYDTRALQSSNNVDVDLYPTFYYDEFSVYSSEVQTSTPPDVYFDISVDDTGSDSVSVTIHFAIYEIDQTTFDSIPTWSGLTSYLVEDGDYSTARTDFYNLNNYASTYVWVVWFEATSKTDVWTVDIALTLRYNWNL
ncbi:MAG: hypothetical protein BV458_07335 [Thermoplasmata archaeon M9B2D]|nr:MAG: hypothetical protein BV458_07335 [Thermoplasmata archaeon M9B2D]